MLKNLPTLERLIRQLQRVPYLASKNIYRVALHFVSLDDASLERFCRSLEDAKKNIQLCSACHNFMEEGVLCNLCDSKDRDKTQICVVETWHDLIALEKAGGYSGVYHILGGVLSPLEGVSADDLSIDKLLERVFMGSVREIILATNPTPEGEATASYIASKINKSSITISKLASGVPIGSSLESMDRVTVYKALLGRRPF